jgi:hypothetical protein
MSTRNDLLANLNRSAPVWGFWGSLGGLAVVIVWGLGMFAIGGMPPIQSVLEHPIIYRLTFVACFAGPIVEIAVLVALAVLASQRSPMRALVGALVALVYVPLNLSCYFLNGAIQPRLAAAPDFGTIEQTISTILAMEHRYSLCFALDVLGYGLLGTGLAIMMSALWGRSRLWTWATAATYLSAVASVAGAIGIFLDSQRLTSACVIGGIFALASSCLTAAAFRQEQSTAVSTEWPPVVPDEIVAPAR